MDIIEVIKSRHSVRSYLDKALEQAQVEALNKEIEELKANQIKLFSDLQAEKLKFDKEKEKLVLPLEKKRIYIYIYRYIRVD